MSQRYIKPTKTGNIFHNSIALLARMGISIWGSRELAVRGRKTGDWHTNPVNLLTFEGERYLVSPRGHTQWVRNIRVSGEGRLRVGRKVETFHPVELTDAEKPPVLRAYLRRWKFEVGMFFDGVDATASDEKLLEIAAGYPVLRVIST